MLADPHTDTEDRFNFSGIARGDFFNRVSLIGYASIVRLPLQYHFWLKISSPLHLTFYKSIKVTFCI
jgi:hypothetical protein